MNKSKLAKISGIEKIGEIGTHIQNKLGDGRIKRILTEETENIVSDAKSRALPISSDVSKSIDHIEKGNYRNSILIGPLYPLGNLAHIFEYGTKPRFTKDGSYRGQIVAKPFMRPAIDVNINDSKSRIALRIKQEVKKIKK